MKKSLCCGKIFDSRKNSISLLKFDRYERIDSSSQIIISKADEQTG
jgi:hypothetical protein